MNDSLLKKGISTIFISIEKNKKEHVKQLNEILCALPEFKNIKTIIYVEPDIDINSLGDLIWSFSNNLDPGRDTFVVNSSDSISHIGLDGTRKTKAHDNFQRNWPNIICADEKTIKAVDAMWSRLGLGEFISSPSLKYRKLLVGKGAVTGE